MKYVLVEQKSLRLEKGDCLHADNLYYLVGKVEKLRYSENVTDIAGAVDAVHDINPGLVPLKDEVYYWEEFGMDGPGKFMLQYPKGNPIQTPKGMRVLIDQLEAPRLDPMRVDLHILPSTFPTILDTNPWLVTQTTTAWFYGWKYMGCSIISPMDAEKIRLSGKRVLEVHAT